jgi:hypothetical protein
LRSLKKTRYVTPRVVIVSNSPTQSDLPGFRKYLKRRKSLAIRLYSPRLSVGREQALRKAYRHTTASSPVFIIDGGDIITTQSLHSVIHLTETNHLRRIHLARQVSSGVSFYEHTIALMAAAAQLMERIRQLFPYSASHLPSGTLLQNPRKHTAHGIYLSGSPIAGSGVLMSPRLLPLVYLTAASFTLLSVLLYAASQAALLQAAQPLLLFLLIIAFAVFVTISWCQTMRPKDKWRLYAFAPISGLVLPVGLSILSGYRLFARSFRTQERRNIRRNSNRSRNQGNVLDNILPLKTRH